MKTQDRFSFGAKPSPKDLRTFTHPVDATPANVAGGYDYLPEEIEHQHKEGICFKGDTQIQMADSSYKRIDKISIGEEVIDAFGDVQKVIDTSARLWQGNMYAIKHYGSSVETIVTPEHPFLMPDGTFKAAKYLTTKDILCIPSIKQIKDKTDFSYETNRDFLKLLGLYLAEGSLEETGRNKVSGRVTFTFHSKEDYLSDFVSATVKDLFDLTSPTYILEDRHTRNVRVSSLLLKDIFLELGEKGSKNKRIHKKLMLLEPSLQLEIVKGWLLGDGSFKKSYQVMGASSSRILIEQMNQILLRNEISASITYRKPYTNTCTHNESWEITINSKDASKMYPELYKDCGKRNIRGNFEKGFSFKQIKSVKKLMPKKDIPVGTTVYNLEVTGTQTYTANGIGVHNCTAIHLTQNAQKVLKKKFSADFHYLLTKKYIDLDWEEGSSIFSSLKVGKNYGFLPVELFTDKKGKPYVTENDRLLPYPKYIAKLQAISDDEVTRLLTLCADKLSGYARVNNDRDSIANAIDTSEAGVLFMILVGEEWYTATDGRISWAEKDINPLRAPKDYISGHAITAAKFLANQFTLANTWGTDWNRKGLGDIDYTTYKPVEVWIPYYNIVPDPIAKKLEKQRTIMGYMIDLLQKLVNKVINK